MYRVAWAVVEKETNESWAWFIGLLIKDLDINDEGDGWVFISDKQKEPGNPRPVPPGYIAMPGARKKQ
uniref:MULE transposase domain-containing protein n=1 Tax=Hordeum vulgare subsp. vulgare TaxID=112509 RepID=A0A8I6X643_HORVV